MSSRGRGRLEVRAAGTVRMELLCGPAGGPRGSQLTGFSCVKGFAGTEEAPLARSQGGTFRHLWACHRMSEVGKPFLQRSNIGLDPELTEIDGFRN